MKIPDLLKESLTVLGFSEFERPSGADLKKKWKELCREYHPDVNNGESEMFKKVTHAYKILTDAEYRLGEIRRRSREGESNIVGSLNVSIVESITFEEAFFGTTKVTSFNVSTLDEEYNPINSEDVPYETRVVKINIPPGCMGGMREVYKGMGNICGDVVGDAGIDYTVKPNPRFRVIGPHVETDEQIPLDVMLKGGKVDVFTMYGIKTVRVPYGSKPNDALKIKGCGTPGGGDHIIRLKPVFPEKEQLKSDIWAGLDIDTSEDVDEEASSFERAFQNLSFRGMKDGTMQFVKVDREDT